MWTPLKIQEIDYMIKKISTSECHRILLSDFVNIWTEEVTSSAVYERCKQFNPLLEGEQDNLVQWTLSLINENSNAKVKVTESDGTQIMEMNSRLAGVPFVFKFYLKLMSSQKFYDELTLPLLLMVQHLQAQRSMLYNLLKKKDIEISEYKMEGAKLSRRNIETAKFVENQFEESCNSIKLYNENRKPTVLFIQEMQTLYADVMKKCEDSTELNKGIKQESDTDDSGAQTCWNDSSPERKRKQNEHILKLSEKDDQDQKKEEERLLAKRKKQVLKKKQLPL